MAVKIRLTRIGRHQNPFYRIVAADSRYARDGRYVQQIGYYDPSKGIANAVIDETAVLEWLAKGAQYSDTIKGILTAKGLLAKAKSTKPEAVKKAKVVSTKSPVAKKAKVAKAPAKKAPAKKTVKKVEETTPVVEETVEVKGE